MSQTGTVVHGEVVESGSHDELMASDGIYAELFRLQAEAYNERHDIDQ
jgi:ABC-type multidrug transport system fused ATPase/permease subunit